MKIETPCVSSLCQCDTVLVLSGASANSRCSGSPGAIPTAWLQIQSYTRNSKSFRDFT
jgi:hypothetical protein